MTAAIELSDADKSVEYSGSPDEIDAQCEALATLDKKTERIKKLAIFGMATGLFVAFIAGGMELYIVSGVMFVLGVASAITYFVVRSDDVEERKITIGRDLLRTLQTELKPGRPVQLHLDFRGYANPKSDGVWLMLRGVLYDGTGVQLQVSTHHKRKLKRKRKYTKIKDKIWERIRLEMRPPKGKQFDPAVAQSLQGITVPALALRGAKVTPKTASFVYETRRMVRARTRYGWQNHDLLSLVDDKQPVAVLIASYRALAVAGRTASAG